MRKVLIANRGEIAVRIAWACRDAGLASVAVYAAPDRDAVHVRAADEAVPLNGVTPAQTYLDMTRVLRAVADSGADALHPGYGFLAESAEFAQSVLDAGLTWIGPAPAVIRLLGDKLSARRAARQVGAPLLPGMTTPVSDVAEVAAFAREHGLPIAIKTASGGGGRGITVARSAGEIPRSYARAVHAAVAGGGRPECFAERYLERARHVETQCLADRYGSVVVISTRDCSLQRRHQKIVEEAPAPFLPAGLDARLRAVPDRSCRRRATWARRRASSCSARTARSPSSRRTPGWRSPTRSAKKSPGSTWSGRPSGWPRASPWVTATRRHAGMPFSSGSTPRIPAAASRRPPGLCVTGIPRQVLACGSTLAPGRARWSPRRSARCWPS